MYNIHCIIYNVYDVYYMYTSCVCSIETSYGPELVFFQKKKKKKER